jgi:ribosomal-protein-alanine N-acetyltransferase
MADVPPVPELTTPRLTLRALVETDAVALHECFGDAATMRFWDSPPTRDLGETIARIHGSRGVSPEWHAAFAVTLIESGRCVGMVNYHGRQPAARRLAIGWIIAPSWRRRGLMREAVTALLHHCFETLDTHRIEARIEPDNIASIGLAEQLGFQREGLMRDWLFVGTQPRSVLLYSVLRPHYTV